MSKTGIPSGVVWRDLMSGWTFGVGVAGEPLCGYLREEKGE